MLDNIKSALCRVWQKTAPAAPVAQGVGINQAPAALAMHRHYAPCITNEHVGMHQYKNQMFAANDIN